MKRAVCIAIFLIGVAIILWGLVACLTNSRTKALPHASNAGNGDEAVSVIEELTLGFAIRQYRYARNVEEQRWAAKIIWSLIAGGEDVRAADEKNLGDTPLHTALGSMYSPFPVASNMADDGIQRIARQLIEAGANVNAKNKLGFTPFHYAVQGYPVELVGFMIAKGADVNVQCSDGWSPLHCAVSSKGGQVVDLLIKSGADVNARLKDGTTPLDLAEANGYKEIAASLRKHGAKPGKPLAD